jgi:hypothetical protein
MSGKGLPLFVASAPDRGAAHWFLNDDEARKTPGCQFEEGGGGGAGGANPLPLLPPPQPVITTNTVIEVKNREIDLVTAFPQGKSPGTRE